MLDESIHSWIFLKDPIVFLIRIPQIKLKQMCLEPVSIGKATERALCASNSLLWKPELLTTHDSISSSKHIVIGSTKLAAHCVLWLDAFSVSLEYRAVYPEKSTHLNDKNLGQSLYLPFKFMYYHTCQGVWIFLRPKP